MRYLSAHYIYPVSSPPIKFGIIVLDEQQRIVEIIDNGGILKEIPNLEFYSGILIPGFINAHAHIELSGLKNLISPKRNLDGFLNNIITLKRNGTSNINSIEKADAALYSEGVVACIDISNTADSLEVKKHSKIHYHTFVELMCLNPSADQDRLQQGLLLQELYLQASLSVSLTLHSLYAVTESFLNLVCESNSFFSIHFLESDSEREFFQKVDSRLRRVYTNNNISLLPEPSNGNHMALINTHFSRKKVLLVHNTFLKENEIQELISMNEEAYFCLCPLSNLFIEGKLPDANFFRGKNTCLGTDSLASNHQLSVFAELQCVLQHFPCISFDEVLRWATLNGARFMNLDNRFGSFQLGKTPGILLIEDFDFQYMKPKQDAVVKRLI